MILTIDCAIQKVAVFLGVVAHWAGSGMVANHHRNHNSHQVGDFCTFLLFFTVLQNFCSRFHSFPNYTLPCATENLLQVNCVSRGCFGAEKYGTHDQ